MVVRPGDEPEVRAVIVRTPWGSFEEAVRGLVQELVASGQLRVELADAAVHAVLDREAGGSTALMEIGVSIPHARLDGVPGIVAVLAVSQTAVYYAHAEVPIAIMVLVLSSPGLSGEYLNFLSRLSLLLQSASTRRSLQDATAASEVIACLRSQVRLP
jgi:PTS system nitrogen regulatory IIA component